MFLFDERYAYFEMFSVQHFAAVLCFIALIVIMIIFRNQISDRVDLWLRRSVAVMMVSFEWIFYAWTIANGGLSLSLLPLGVCSTSMYFTSYALWTKNEKVFQFIFPWAIAGSLISLVVANLHYSFPHFRYIHYFGNHGFFLTANLYFLIVLKFRFSYKNLLKSGAILFIYALVMYPINFLLDTNHLFLREIPIEAAPMYSFLGDSWVIGFVFSIFLLFHIIYIPLYFYNKKYPIPSPI
ncbi:MAG: TIGR02206 family membrane protein [Firmicutes bacterium]|nr:TIGR02206 family membrane protein [Bacillota bacterium]